MEGLLEQLRMARLPASKHPNLAEQSMEETRHSYQVFTDKTKLVQIREMSTSREKKKKREWRTCSRNAGEFRHTRDSFSRLEKEHIDPNLSNWEKEHIHFLSRSYRHPPKFKGMSSSPSKERFDEPNAELLASRYRPILQKRLDYCEDYELSPSKFGKTWVDFKRQRVVPPLKLTPFSTQWRNDDFKFYKQTRSNRG